MSYKKIYKFSLFTLLIFFSFINNSHSQNYNSGCQLSSEDINAVIDQIKINKNLVRNLPECIKSNHDFASKIINFDDNYFEYISNDIKDDEIFIKRFISTHPDILQYISPRLQKNKFFFSDILNLAPDVLKYADPALLDNKVFMLQMVEKNPKNYLQASERLQNDFDLTMLAVKNDGEIIKYTSDEMQNNKAIALAAVNSYTPAINFINPTLQRDAKIKKISRSIDYNFLGNFSFYLKNNYSGIAVGPKGSRGYRIVNKGKFFEDKIIISRPDETKWKMIYEKGEETDEFKLANPQTNFSWKNDLKKYPGLIKQIEKIFSNNRVDQNTVNSLTLIDLWEVASTPKTLAFRLYLTRDIEDQYLTSNMVNLTSLTAIAKKQKDKWIITVIDSKFDINAKPSINIQSGFKKYQIWDLYKSSKKDKTPKVLFKIEDEDSEYFELFVQQPNGRLASVFKGEGYSNFD